MQKPDRVLYDLPDAVPLLSLLLSFVITVPVSLVAATCAYQQGQGSVKRAPRCRKIRKARIVSFVTRRH
jgi:hypothetical protein